MNQYNASIMVPSCLGARTALVASRDDETGRLSDRQGLSYKKDHHVHGQKDMLYLPKAQEHVQPLNMNSVCIISNCVYRQIHKQFIQLIERKVVCKLFNALCIPLHLCIPLCDHLIENVSNK
jgi:hypothetical protein